MEWTKWLHTILAFIVTEVDSNCGEFSLNRKLHEISPLIIETKLGQTVSIRMPETGIKSNVVSVLTLPSGEHYNISPFIAGNVNSFSSMIEDEIHEIQKDVKDVIKMSLNHTQENGHENATRITLGPITEDYFGNWVVSSCFVDEFGTDTELFQVVSVHVEEHIDTIPKGSIAVAARGELRVRLDRPVPGLRSCELAGPPAAAERAYERDPAHAASCGFVLRDVRARDAGEWRVLAVGRIVHVATLDLVVYS